MPCLVLDTNIVLDLFVFGDARTAALNAALAQAEHTWIATPAMRDELEHVLVYPHIQARMALAPVTAAEVLANFDRLVRVMDAPAKAAVTCKDPDDQKFIDLAVAHRCMLLSKDAAVLSMRKRLAALEVTAAAVLPVDPPPAPAAAQSSRPAPSASTA